MGNQTRQAGFTLIEIVLAMTIMALVMVSVFSILQTGMGAYQQGQAGMDLYQSGRIGLQKVSEELRFALSPYAFWRPEDTFVLSTLDDAMARFNGMAIQEEDPGAIRFMGEGNSVLFVRKVYQLGKPLPFDLQECQIFVENDELILEVVRSLLMVKQATWFFQYEFEVNLAGQVLPDGAGGRVRLRQIGPYGEPPLIDYIGDYGYDGRRYLLAKGVKSIQFRYTDGEGWKNSWDSTQVIIQNRISPQSPNFNQQADSIITEKGPPQVVEITLELTNGDTFATAADVPAGNMQRRGLQAFLAPEGTGQMAGAGTNNAPGSVDLSNRPQTETPMGGPVSGI